jgi:hypothetical protein
MGKQQQDYQSLFVAVVAFADVPSLSSRTCLISCTQQQQQQQQRDNDNRNNSNFPLDPIRFRCWTASKNLPVQKAASHTHTNKQQTNSRQQREREG